MNFKEHFEKFEADLRKKMLDDETIIESLKDVSQQHEELVITSYSIHYTKLYDFI